ncbi:hypothetical protein AT251_10570 [Enterovibrio nigricans]|uniref:Uncharacterized protein n=1 Tax=Enterovibrio nigricans DSM 22720 TaxID=1121868 RepID=A0A1T4V119_9GAMM|nr:hypothetical protein [Enterovibrio nigricans]PKF50566.1 hypothetical protein AT251_10570 [Enterovibrio nigricans]SKA58649.1 hypothetical protein SAMN02745132_03010 [Enterovibrio nigricans DSM 22720]
MIINFNLFKNKHSWNSTVHQINSDVLTRHVLVKGNVENMDLNFTFCETSGKGCIISDGGLIGEFSVF